MRLTSGVPSGYGSLWGTFRTALVRAVATTARPEDLQAIEATVKDQGGMSALLA